MGKYKSDCTLPSINKLSREYQVSRDTVFKAFIDLKDRGIIDSTPGKGYYVTNKLTNILLLLDEYSPFKYSLYNSFIKKLSINYKVCSFIVAHFMTVDPYKRSGCHFLEP